MGDIHRPKGNTIEYPMPRPRMQDVETNHPLGVSPVDHYVDQLRTALNAVGLERAERNRIARECAEATQERDRLQELVNRLRPLAEAAIAEDIAEELADQPDAAPNKLIADELRDARDERRRAVRVWHDLAAGDVAEGRAPLGDVG